MKVSYILALILFIPLSNSYADEKYDKAMAKAHRQFVISATKSLMDAKIEGACLKQIDINGNQYIANKEECSKEVNSIITGIEGNADLEGYKKKLIQYKNRYGLT